MKPIGVRGDGGVEWHARALSTGPDYDTACCVDANDRGTGTYGTVEPKMQYQKITCPQCYRLWRGVLALDLQDSDFAPGAKK